MSKCRCKCPAQQAHACERSTNDRETIAYIAMWRIDCQAGQNRAHQPRNSMGGGCCEGSIHLIKHNFRRTSHNALGKGARLRDNRIGPVKRAFRHLDEKSASRTYRATSAWGRGLRQEIALTWMRRNQVSANSISIAILPRVSGINLPGFCGSGC